MASKFFQKKYIGIWCLLFVFGCSNQKNTYVSRQYHALTTHYNVYFNGKESLKKGESKIEDGIVENYTLLLPVFEYEDPTARSLSSSEMDRVLEKATKAIKLHSITRKPKRKKDNQSEKYREFRKKKEYNDWIDDCYLLIGKAKFYKKEYRVAEKAFEFIQKEYPESDLIPEAKLGQARSLIDRGELTAGTEILDRLSDEPQISKDLILNITTLRASIAIKEKDYERAIDELERAIILVDSKIKKGRYYYIIAQLNEKLGNLQAVSIAFQNVVDINASYEMTFNAKISRALSYTGNENGPEIRKSLKKMFRDEKNNEYQDQIYYALAEMDVKDGNMESAIHNYWESTKHTVYNENQKAISFLKLGDYYFEELNYPKSQMCYDSSMTYLGKDYPNYSVISVRISNLTDLVNNLNIVEREDSLQTVALMSDLDRDKLIQGIIQKIKDKEKEQRLKKAELASTRAFYSQNDMLGSSSRSSSTGNWYFYNPTVINLGKAEFLRKWGRRRLADNWRRKNKSEFDFDDVDLVQDDDSKTKDSNGKDSIATEAKRDPKLKDYYLYDLPLTEAAIEKSNERIMLGLYQASLVYEEKLHNQEKALETIETLMKRFPENPYLLSSYYHAFSLNKKMGNSSKAAEYKNKILTEFKGSEYAKALSDPNYLAKIEAEDLRANKLYEAAYEDYKNFYYLRVIKGCNEGLLRYPESELRPQFLFLRALCIGRTQPVAQFKQSLEQLLNSEPSSAIAATTKAILQALKEGAVPMQFTELDMEQARQNRLLRNWRMEDDQAMIALEDKEKDVKAKPLYKFVEDEEHYFILLFAKKDADANRSLFNVSKYNSESYNNRVFKVDRLSLNKDQIMIMVKGLKGKEDALNYFNGIITSNSAFNGLENIDYRNFVISVSNFNIFKKNEDIESYLDFYTKSYFNVARNQDKTTVRKNNKLVAVNSNLDSTNFTVNPSDNHKFILLVPVRKVNLAKLRNDIFNHDKDFSVIRDQYDSDLNMIVVNNIGSKTDAMAYFRNLIKDESVYIQLSSVDYRNFIISEENFKKFYISKSLFPYLDFFKENYLKDEVMQKESPKEEPVQEGLYTYRDDVPHSFALVYATDNVNTKLLLNGIKKYNTKSLEVEVRTLDQNREVLLVSNMRNKKQAMMYFRAIVTNRSLFAPIEKVGYRNFVISDENLELFMKDTDPAVYLQFFKKWYLQ
ncbi:tetratricopeptide repeat protein [Labilibaculum sp.]|uniref:type IX secretion system periplasmic lipoprotein PorW/SprE n=1 Tax=Labilibaculum sp. TaxID=2060723 RepID=UPI0035646E03